MYHDTTNLAAERLPKAISKSAQQQATVLEFFKRNSEHDFAPSEVKSLAMPDSLLTSVRRSITDLTKEGLLVKLETQREGPYGRPEHCWKINR